MKELLIIAIGSAIVNNVVLSQFLGICPFLGVSKDFKSALGMGLAVTFVMTLTCLITYPIYTFILVPLGIEFMEIIVFIFIIAAIVQMIEMALKKFSPTLYNAMGIYLPLITTNCAVLGVAELVIDTEQISSLIGIATTEMNMGFAVLYGLFAGLGFTVAIVIMSGLREKIARIQIKKSFQGFPIAMITACFIAMAFYVFALI